MIKSPLNYVGGKFKLLPQILPLFPKNIEHFVDLFGGGANVCLNVDAKHITYVDILSEVVGFLNCCQHTKSSVFIEDLNKVGLEYNLSKDNEEGYKELRKYYNTGMGDPILFYALVSHSFNNQIRFNKKKQFNLPFGKRSCFNPVSEKKLIDFIEHIQSKDINFLEVDFRKLDFKHIINRNPFIYCDPPYLISTATYNEQDGWTEKDEKDLLNLLDDFDSRKINFALSNVLESKGRENILLKEWSKRYNVHILDKDYKNSNHQRVKNDVTVEVLITNY